MLSYMCKLAQNSHTTAVVILRREFQDTLVAVEELMNELFSEQQNYR